MVHLYVSVCRFPTFVRMVDPPSRPIQRIEGVLVKKGRFCTTQPLMYFSGPWISTDYLYLMKKSKGLSLWSILGSNANEFTKTFCSSQLLVIFVPMLLVWTLCHNSLASTYVLRISLCPFFLPWQGNPLFKKQSKRKREHWKDKDTRNVYGWTKTYGVTGSESLWSTS